MSLSPKSGRDLALIRWGDTLRRQRQRQRRRRIRVAMGSALLAIFAGSIAWHPTPRLIWNASASAPIGLYRVSPGAWPMTGDLVAARLAPDVARLAASRSYLPLDVPLVKHVAGVPGDTICAFNGAVSINGLVVAARLPHDTAGRPLVGWNGCHRLGADRFLLLNAEVPTSFDGRYFGASRRSDIIGTVTPLWLG
jgi:conjugative transfer signal peptidase TraF